MIRKIHADRIYFMDGQDYRTDAVIVVDDEGRILEILPDAEVATEEKEYYTGWIIPGLVNTHCHLELSHMKGLIPSGTGLIPFLQTVVQQREASQEAIMESIRKADKAMYDSGIVAVGDISNLPHTLEVKQDSPIEYYTFIETFDFLQEKLARTSYDNSMATYQLFKAAPGLPASIVPHAPYSTSPELIRLINSTNGNEKHKTISIHNQEMQSENDLFLYGDSAIPELFRTLGIEMENIEGRGYTSIHYLMEHLDPHHRILLVHNTLTTAEEIRSADEHFPKLYWSTCAQANLYIENRLPDYAAFESEMANMTIGTDSLSSNWNLSVWDEMCTIKKYNSYLSFETLLEWATTNGAEALGMEERFGKIVTGRKPGLNLISEFDQNGDPLTQKALITKLV